MKKILPILLCSLLAVSSCNKKEYAVIDVKLSKTDISLNVGSSETLVATVVPSTASNKEVIWSTSNNSVANVSDSGEVTAVDNGNATITVRTVDGNKTATCMVTVTTAVTGISINKTILSMILGANETLVATIIPSTASNKSVIWSSSNTDVATVDENGTVTIKNKGLTLITVKTEDGGKTASCTVKVKGNDCPAGAVDLGLSVYWATSNLGASEPTSYGDYYAWGAKETWYDVYPNLSPYDVHIRGGLYCWETCPFNDGNYYYDGDYWNAHKSECVDANDVLLLDYDVAHEKLGGNWRMPTKEEFDELVNNCYCSWSKESFLTYMVLKSKKQGYIDNKIILPNIGNIKEDLIRGFNSYGCYWSSSINKDNPQEAWYCYSSSDQIITRGKKRCFGCCIRPVSE